MNKRTPIHLWFSSRSIEAKHLSAQVGKGRINHLGVASKALNYYEGRRASATASNCLTIPTQQLYH